MEDVIKNYLNENKDTIIGDDNIDKISNDINILIEEKYLLISKEKPPCQHEQMRIKIVCPICGYDGYNVKKTAIEE